MSLKIYEIFKNYENWTLFRFILKLIPKVGDQLDFLITEQLRKISKTTSHIITTPQYEEIVSRLKSIPIINDELKIHIPPNISGPKLFDCGRLKIEPKTKSLSSMIAMDLKKQKQPNDPCAILLSSSHWEDKESLTLSYNSVFYADVKALRANGRKVYLISVGGVLFSEDEQCLLVHRRSTKSEDYPETLHIFGGAYMPPDLGDRGDIGGIKECLVREVHEETGISIIIPDNTPILTIDEYNIDFVQIAFLGINISNTQMKPMRPSWEGTISEIPFNELYERMKNIKEWTISGWVLILLWLALGTPNSNRKLIFGDQTAEELCKSLISHITFGSTRQARLA